MYNQIKSEVKKICVKNGWAYSRRITDTVMDYIEFGKMSIGEALKRAEREYK